MSSSTAHPADSPKVPKSVQTPPAPKRATDLAGLQAKLKELLAWAQETRLARAFSRYGTAHGALLAGGIAYTGLFSVFAALAIGVTVLMAGLGSHPTLRDAVLKGVGQKLPGVIDNGDGSGLVSIDQLTLDSALNLGSIIAMVLLLLSALGLMGALATALRAMFGLAQLPRNIVVTQLLNLAGFVVLLVSVVVTAAASIVTGALTEQVNTLLHLPAFLSGWGTRILSLAVALLVDATVFALLIRLSGVRAPRRDLVLGSLMAGFAFGLVREAGTKVVGSVAKNPLLASFAAIIVLVLWIHLAARITLLVAAWIANPPKPRVVGHPAELRTSMRPNYVTLSVPETLTWPRQSLTGNLDVDPTLNPSYVAPPVAAEPSPRHPRGLRGWWERRRFAAATARYEKARQRYYLPVEAPGVGFAAEVGATKPRRGRGSPNRERTKPSPSRAS
ncbi:Inner membrane protein yhjD [Actinomyces bovis]|uniref:Inner membrane protein yhjD n=1 Tax=Actinomyces bovis TaxID=1658 RepID=A0ABY1VN77_9ACTO|nr:YihY/virulence factor BrkB family protein [Actinomyces bovis]SPT53450.1 Inner membrane protein yhjD [Actinomyces bovis]VEG52928.1 Inner membrane protein yhjD [Actinomyces israelii]